MTIKYTRDLKIKNIEVLPAGTGAKFLEVTEGENGDFVAKQWRRKEKTTGIFIKFF